jgi:plastocyanin
MLRKSPVLATVLVFTAASSWGYQAEPVQNGGIIKGQVKVAGAIPKDETVEVTRNQPFCGQTLPQEKYVISAKGGVKNVTVTITDMPKGKPVPATEVVVDNRKCAFHPHVQVGVTGQTLKLRNDDPMLHNAHLYLDKKTLFNVALPIQGGEIAKSLDKTGLIRIGCDVHSWMKGYLQVADHPYITVTDEEGNFSMTDVPPGSYDLTFWHEAFGARQRQVTVEANGTAGVQVEYSK